MPQPDVQIEVFASAIAAASAGCPAWFTRAPTHPCDMQDASPGTMRQSLSALQLKSLQPADLLFRSAVARTASSWQEDVDAVSCLLFEAALEGALEEQPASTTSPSVRREVKRILGVAAAHVPKCTLRDWSHFPAPAARQRVPA